MASLNKKRKANMKPGDVVVTPTTSYVVNKNGKLVRMPTESEQKNVENLRKRMKVTQQELDMARLRKEESKANAKPKAKVAPKRKKK